VPAAALSPLVRVRASGAHYSSTGQFPFAAGVDGVGRLDDGRRVYFHMSRAPYGAMAEETVAPSTQCLSVPDELDDVRAAVLQAAASAGFRIAAKPVPLSEVEQAWARDDGGQRVVFTVDRLNRRRKPNVVASAYDRKEPALRSRFLRLEPPAG
jgi:NADPH:quinone reductase-like Zn-dependent oxidoreductase